MDLEKAKFGEELMKMRYSIHILKYYKLVSKTSPSKLLSSLACYDIQSNGKHSDKIKQSALHIMGATKDTETRYSSIWKDYLERARKINVNNNS